MLVDPSLYCFQTVDPAICRARIYDMVALFCHQNHIVRSCLIVKSVFDIHSLMQDSNYLNCVIKDSIKNEMRFDF